MFIPPRWARCRAPDVYVLGTYSTGYRRRIAWSVGYSLGHRFVQLNKRPRPRKAGPMAPSVWPGAVPLDSLLHAVSSAFVRLISAPSGVQVSLASVLRAHAGDLANEQLSRADLAGLCLHAGVPEELAVSW